jgi:catechol 2,3-dioxygenase-like lactoylglutathione lyase family enzyme
MDRRNSQGFGFRGINHLALVCKDMAKTVEFYRDILGMPLIKTLELPNNGGQHFFFDCGNGNSIAFFWFPNAPEAQPGVVQAKHGGGVSAHGSMNHVAIDVDGGELLKYRQKLIDKGIDVTDVKNHGDTTHSMGEDTDPTTFVRSIYFHDPDGIRLELAAWTRELGLHDIYHEPRDAGGKPVART